MSIDRNKPTFQLLPYNNNRTAWRPIGFPAIMVVPRRFDAVGHPLPNSQVFNVRVLIESVPREARVAGHDHVGIRYPDRELYARTINYQELAERVIDLDDVDIYRDGQLIEEPKTGDIIHYMTRTGTRGTLEFIHGAKYYDLSDIRIDVETLPADDYNLAYQTQYFDRVITSDASRDLLCIDTNTISLAIFRVPIQHPGKVMDEFYRHTPPPYVSDASRAVDGTVSLYRPLTDVLQDVADEQLLLESINFVYDTPPEAIPYLSQLLGWEIPYFPQSLDSLRRAVLRRTVALQNLKGSRRALIELFRLFGFEILTSNLWWSSDGEILIRPDESLPYKYHSQRISTLDKPQTDVLLSDWFGQNFGQYSIPLLHRPQVKTDIDNFTALQDGGSVTIKVFVVERDGPAYAELSAISQQLQQQPHCDIQLESRMVDEEIIGRTYIVIDGKFGEPARETVYGSGTPITSNNVSMDRDRNKVSLEFAGALREGACLFAFAYYTRQEFVVPDILQNLQSNRFDLTVLTDNTFEFVDPTVLDFAIEFLYRLKAFHSLLRVIRYRIELSETYEVTDLRVGGDVAQRYYDTDIGNLQVPPAIIPDVPEIIDDCTRMDPVALGYKPEDIALRDRKLEDLLEEFTAWLRYDDRENQSGDTRLAPLAPVPGRDTLRYTRYGQDRIVPGYENGLSREYGPGPNSNQAGFNVGDLSPQDTAVDGQFNTVGPDATTNSDSSQYGSFTREYREDPVAWPQLDDNSDYCYKGRVDDEILYQPLQRNDEHYRCQPCNLGLGSGAYYLLPSRTVPLAPGNRNRLPGSMSNKLVFTGGAQEEHQEYYASGIQGEYLKAPYDQPLAPKNNSLLGRLYHQYDTPEPYTLHYTDRPFLEEDQRYQLALQRPEIHIEKATLHLPGCRFPRLNALENDYVNTNFSARPWDAPYGTYCGPSNICPGSEPSLLNAYLEVRADGNEYLVFDEVDYKVEGNNLVPDIPSLGDHTLGTDALFESQQVIHKVYTNQPESPYVDLDATCYRTESQDIMEVQEPLFSSYYEQDTGGYLDYADGYPCLRGFIPTFDLDHDGYDYVLSDQVTGGMVSKTELLGTPTGIPDSCLFLLSSGIRHTTGLRLDCGCLLAAPEITGAPEPICCLDPYMNQDGELDLRCDHADVHRHAVLHETLGSYDLRLDGSIPSLMEVNPQT